MPNYNFYDSFYLSPLRFQQFACAVMSVRENCVFQRFGEGPDGGIDGLYVSGEERIVLQVKHTEAKGSALLGILRGERRRIRKMSCDRYILILSSRSVRDECKEEIREIFPEIIDTQDIITGLDLNGYLELPEYAHIEKAYPELWLNSGNYLEDLLEKHMSADILRRSRVKLDLMAKEKKTFIAAEVFEEALEILREHQRVIISGEPGAGKTAHAVCLADYCIEMDGYEELYFVNSLEEIEQILGSGGGRKVIVFDDFWGHGAFSESRMELNADRRMEEIFRVLPCYPEIRLIFTTREFVLQQGLRMFPELESVSELNKVTLRLSTYTLAQKSRILYRHLEAAELGFDYAKEIFERKEDILYAEAYSPRSVAYFLEDVPPDGMEPEEYAERMVEYVQAPNKYFENIFVQLSYGAQLICLLLLLSGEEIRVEQELKKEFMIVADACACPEKVEKIQFANYLRELEGVFTKINESFYTEDTVLDFLNFSIRDFMEEYLNSHIEAYEMLFAENCIYYNQLFYMASELDISEECCRRLTERMINERNKLKYSFVFSMDVDGYYSVNAAAWEYEENKVWQLYVLCKKQYDRNLYQFLDEYCTSLVSRLYQKELGDSEMEAVVNLIPYMMELGWKTDEEKLVEAYYENIHRADEIQMIRYLRPCCPEYYDRFMEEHLEEIRGRLPYQILDDIEEDMDKWDGDERIDDLLSSAPVWFEQYGIEYTADFEREMYERAERLIPKKTKKSRAEKGKRTESRYTIEKRDYERAAKQAEEWFLPQIKYLSPRKIKEIEREFGKDYRRGWLTKGAFTEDDFMLVMEYLGALPEIPRTEDEFYDGLTDFLTEQWTGPEKMALRRMAQKLTEKEIFYFTEKEAARYCGFGKNDRKSSARKPDGGRTDDLTEKMKNSGIVHRTGRWLHFWNWKMMLCLAAQNTRG